MFHRFLRETTTLLVIVFLLGGPASAEDSEETGLSNANVVRMISAGLGDSLVVAKIRQSPEANFDLEVDDLIDLKSKGVSEEVVQAMLEWSSPSVFDNTSSPAGSAGTSTASQIGFMQEDLGYETIRVALETSEGEQRLRVQRGEFSTTGMGMMTFVNYPGLHSRIRTSDHRPRLLVKSRSQLTGGRYFLAKLDSDTDDGIRSLKVSSAKGRFKAMFGNSSKMLEPDRDWTVPYDVEEMGADLWRVVPKEELEPGEYGWYVDLGAGAQQATIFDFGVD